jgi:hypothetical protein
MTGPRPAGRPWTPTEDAQLREFVISSLKVSLIAKKLKRSPGSIYARINSFKKLPRDLPFGANFGARSGSLPSERLVAYAKAETGDLKDGN